jgi:hypothetical protein
MYWPYGGAFRKGVALQKGKTGSKVNFLLIFARVALCKNCQPGRFSAQCASGACKLPAIRGLPGGRFLFAIHIAL